MTEAGVLTRLKVAQGRNVFRMLRTQSRLRLAIVCGASVVFWLGLYGLFYAGLRFFQDRAPEHFQELVSSLLYLFFFVLSVMLFISNGIICYSSLYKARETGFLLSAPLRTESIFLYKFIESLGFSSWALLFLATPMMVAYGRVFGVPWGFYPLSIVFFTAFMWIPAGLGALAAMLLANFLPNLRRRLVPLAVVSAIAAAVLLGAKFIELRSRQSAEIRLVVDILESVEWSRHPLLPSTWVTKGILEVGDGRLADGSFFFGLITANAAFGLTVLSMLSVRLLREGWFLTQGMRRARRAHRGWLDAMLHRGLFFLPEEMRLIVVKDVKSFVRDPVRWSEFLIFFGLLGVYFANLRTFGYENKEPGWKLAISQMNLLATALVLATFSSRFIFPQLSLEGRRFWILGAMPIARETVLYAKLAFAFVVSLLVSETLIAVSSVMLRLPLVTALTHAVVLLAVCLGLSGMAVGLGAVYPNFREDNPSKIVSGLGGTVNLIFNLLFVIACIVIQALPFLAYTARLAESGTGAIEFKRDLVLAVGGVALAGLAACLIPMALGLRALRRLEI